MPRCTALPFLLLGLSLSAQSPALTEAETIGHAARAIRLWATEFERGQLQPKATLRRSSDLQPAYVAAARAGNFVYDGDEGRVTHLDMLGKLLFFAERHGTPEIAEAVLGVAAIGFEGAFLDLQAHELRELGHWTLMRIEDQGAWFLVLRAAAGESVAFLSGLRGADAPTSADGVAVGPARRVAALHLIGRRNLPVFRSTLEAAFVDADPRVRLAAAEAISPPWRAESVRSVATALGNERHPVVAQALVRALLSMLKSPPAELVAEERGNLVDGALQQFGRCGWQTDMDLLDIVAAFPHKQAIPVMIDALDLTIVAPDALVELVNKRASPLRRERAATLLRAMTGALLPDTDVAAWREFWAREQERIVVPSRLARDTPGGTRATFFGVPVTGGSIGFLIDTSGSMESAPATEVQTGARRRGQQTRLAAAKEQLVLAAQAMPAESQYYVFTFADRARTWTSTPIQPGRRNLGSLTELLSRLQPHGGTNVYDGLQTALQWGERRYGEMAKTRIDELFVLTDGEPTAGTVTDTDDLLELVRESNKYAKVRIHAVFTGTGKGSDWLRKLAEENGGVYVQR